MKKTVVMEDVARKAGVSAQTVSRVVNNHPSVRPATRERVYQAMRELNYKPNYAAQLLASGSSRSIGVLTVGHLHHGLMPVFSELQTKARKAGFFVLTAAAESENEKDVVEAIEYLQHRQVRASILFSPYASLIPIYGSRDIGPAILLTSTPHRIPGVTTVGLDQRTGMQQALDHLWEQGVNDTVHLAGDLKYIDGSERATVFQRYSSKHRKPSTIVGGVGWGCEDGYQAGQEILESGLPEAIIAGNDKLAVGAMKAFSEAGYQAGVDYRIIGFDDDETSAYLNPSLTSVRQDFEKLADVAVKGALGMMAGEEPTSIHIPTELFVRESSQIKN